MAIITRTQSTSRSSAGPAPATLSDAGQFAPLTLAPRHSGHTATRSHVVHIIWPEHYHQRFRLPLGVEHQPF